VHEHVFCAIIADDEAKALLTIEEFYDAGAFAHDLGRHGRTWSATAAAAVSTATATAAEAVTAAAAETITATEAITSATGAIAAACSGISAIAIVTEAVALVSAAPAALAATPFIKTHALSDFPEFIVRKSLEPKHRTMGTWYSAQNHYAPSSRNSPKKSIPRAILIRRLKHLVSDCPCY
jgi:hypothetical protein